VVEALIGLMNCEQAAGNVFNIGSNEEIAIAALADKIIEMTGSKSEKKFITYEEAYGRPIEDMMRRLPSLKRIEKFIGWKPTTSLTEALKAIINHIQTNNSKE
jgi:UDP-glucose 4-epimerase